MVSSLLLRWKMAQKAVCKKVVASGSYAARVGLSHRSPTQFFFLRARLSGGLFIWVSLFFNGFVLKRTAVNRRPSRKHARMTMMWQGMGKHKVAVRCGALA
jgi:hypothetical protein